ncbi:MAG: hypothetical protein IH845_04490 [Nanoarchaeota archaeon]|nr:hypothetical protein [Nanoarchaeota archaeon]
MINRKKVSRNFLFGIITLFMFVFISSFVFAGPVELIADFKEIFGIGDNAGDGSKIFTKLLLGALVTLIVYSVSDMFIDEKEPIKWGLSIIIAILAFISISPETINYILINYEALGVALTSIIPLAVFIAVVAKIRLKHPVAGKLINGFGVPLFVLYLFVSWIVSYGEEGFKGSALAWIYPISFIIAIVWYFAADRIVAMIEGAEKEAIQEDAGRTIEEAGDALGELSTLEKSLAGRQRKKVI